MSVSAPFVSVIVPVLDDERELQAFLTELGAQDASLGAAGGVELIVVDGGSARQEALAELERRFGRVQWLRTGPGRGGQMNAGAAVARGRWLLFVHADTRLEHGWLDDLRALEERPALVGGAFRFALDSRDWRARVVEWAVGRRVRWFKLPYGDQAIFARRDRFHEIGGYADLPLMEDLEFVRRLAASGRLVWLERRAITSARRWERDGWIRRSAGNVLLLAQYLAGASPARLAERYWGPPDRRRVGASAGFIID
jgi:rSAM/selenodomain-associated transferase 2